MLHRLACTPAFLPPHGYIKVQGTAGLTASKPGTVSSRRLTRGFIVTWSLSVTSWAEGVCKYGGHQPWQQGCKDPLQECFHACKMPFSDMLFTQVYLTVLFHVKPSPSTMIPLPAPVERLHCVQAHGSPA